MTEPPFVTVIMPIRNEADSISNSLSRVLAQDYPAKYMEIIIADGMSTDATLEIVQEFAALHPQLQIHILDNPGKIVPTGMNIALRQAKGKIIIRVDGHCIIASDYVSKCVEHIQTDGVDGVGGPMESIGETHMAKAIAIGMSSPFGVGNSAFRTMTGKSMLADTVPFPAYTRQIVERAGFYDEELVRNQDDEYNYRIRGLGGKILLADDVRSTYFSRTSLKVLWRQYYQYGYWKVRVLQKHPLQMSLRQFVPPLFAASLLVSILYSLLSAFLTPLATHHLPLSILPYPISLLPLILILGAYLFANLAASIYTSYRRRVWAQLPLLSLTFATLHVGYGLGFLVGLTRFSNRWNDKVGKVPSYEQA